MKTFAFLLACLPCLNAGAATETIVLMRHGEKPAAGLGQLDCRGLNRSLALPKVLLTRFGEPAAIFAPNPGEQKDDNGVLYNYGRPLATIEPTAILSGLPVDASLGFADIAGLQARILSPAYVNVTIFVAWEHREAERFARNVLNALESSDTKVPIWKADDFDSLYVISILTKPDGSRKASFSLQRQNLDGQTSTCPGN